MAVLVTRPEPDNETTAAALRARGFAVMSAPMLLCEPLALQDEANARYGAIIVTSANALRAISDQPGIDRLRTLPLFAVGERTAQTARAEGFLAVHSADGDATALRDLLVARVRAKLLRKTETLLYLAGADLARDLAGDLGERGFNVVTHTSYRMTPVTALPAAVGAAFAAGEIDAVLHYSRRSARAFFDAARGAGVEISALAAAHGCLSEAVAAVARDAGVAEIMVAPSPDENALFDLLDRAFRLISR